MASFLEHSLTDEPEHRAHGILHDAEAVRAHFTGLVSRGRSVYEGALRNPETLTDLVPMDSEWFAEFEEFLYLPVYALEQKTGKAVPLPDPLETPETLVEPDGEPWNKETVDTLFPKLSQRAKKRFQS